MRTLSVVDSYSQRLQAIINRSKRERLIRRKLNELKAYKFCTLQHIYSSLFAVNEKCLQCNRIKMGFLRINEFRYFLYWTIQTRQTKGLAIYSLNLCF